MKTKRPVSSDFNKDVVYPIGTEIVLVEQLGKDTWIGEVRIPDDALVGGARWDTVTVKKGDLEDDRHPV